MTRVIGMAGLLGALLVPGFLLLVRVRPQRWADPEYAPIDAMAVICVLYAIGCLPNGTLYPLFVVGGGAVVSVLMAPATGVPARGIRRSSTHEEMI